MIFRIKEKLVQHGISCLLITKKFLFWNFWGWKMWYFLSQKVDGKMIFTDYWKVLVLNFSVMRNMVFFWVKKLMEKMIFTDYGKVLVLNFVIVGNTVFFESRSWWKDDIYWLLRSSCFELFGDGKYGLFLSQEVDGKMIFTGYREVLVLNFSVRGNTVFFESRSW